MVLGLDRGLLTLSLGEQIIRSSISAVLNNGEAQSAESRKDFIHKNSIVLKELRETSIGLRILFNSGAVKDDSYVVVLIKECDH